MSQEIVDRVCFDMYIAASSAFEKRLRPAVRAFTQIAEPYNFACEAAQVL